MCSKLTKIQESSKWVSCSGTAHRPLWEAHVLVWEARSMFLLSCGISMVKLQFGKQNRVLAGLLLSLVVMR